MEQFMTFFSLFLQVLLASKVSALFFCQLHYSGHAPCHCSSFVFSEFFLFYFSVSTKQSDDWAGTWWCFFHSLCLNLFPWTCQLLENIKNVQINSPGQYGVKQFIQTFNGFCKFLVRLLHSVSRQKTKKTPGLWESLIQCEYSFAYDKITSQMK